jgi:hypothetical protein
VLAVTALAIGFVVHEKMISPPTSSPTEAAP